MKRVEIIKVQAKAFDLLEAEKCPTCGKQSRNPNVGSVTIQFGFKPNLIRVDVLARCPCGKWYSVLIQE